MTRWWKGMAVFAAWLAVGVAGQAQQQLPEPWIGAARSLEPLNYCPKPQPELAPGPLTPAIAPVGPPDCLSLPANHTSAFQCENFAPECAAFGAIGGFGWRRDHPGNLPLVFPAGAAAPPPVAPGFFPGTPGSGTTPLAPLFDLHNLQPSQTGGVRATLGYLWCNEAVELTGMYQPASKTVVDTAGAALIPFTGLPAGFTGANNPFAVANLVRTRYTTEFASGELNYRRWDSGINRIELILGVRYLFTRETLDLVSEATPIGGAMSALYAVHTRNNIVAPQFGGEYSTPCPIPYLKWIWFTGMGKAAGGVNFVDRNWSLTRNDGLLGASTSRSNVQFGQVYELSGFLDLHLLERLRVRLGYMALWAVGVSNPANQVDFNIATQGSRKVDSSSSFWHGPVAEMQFLW